MKKYVISEDLEQLLKNWAAKKDFKIPNHNFFLELQRELLDYLSRIFTWTIFVDYQTLSQGIRRLIEPNELSAVSIDRVYDHTRYHLELNRVADENFNIIGEAERPGSLPLEEQIEKLPHKLPLVIVDDGIFSGDTLIGLINLLKLSGRLVKQIIVGLDIQSGEREILKQYPQLQIKSVLKFKNVIDWVCERDFYLGAPLSGRTLGFYRGAILTSYYPDIALPYCLPFGDPSRGASIPIDQAKAFSKFILGQSIKLWKAIEKESQKTVTYADIPRLPIVISNDSHYLLSFVEFLIKTKNKIN